MSNETKKEPATTGSLTPEPVVKKRRGRKPSKKQYFTADVDAAIQEYLASSNQAERNEIYRTRIAYAFYKLAENLIHTFKFYYTEVESLEDLKHEVCCFFLEKLDYWKPERGTKAFSYFSIVGKNYLILYNNNNYKKKKQKADMEMIHLLSTEHITTIKREEPFLVTMNTSSSSLNLSSCLPTECSSRKEETSTATLASTCKAMITSLRREVFTKERPTSLM